MRREIFGDPPQGFIRWFGFRGISGENGLDLGRFGVKKTQKVSFGIGMTTFFFDKFREVRPHIVQREEIVNFYFVFINKIIHGMHVLVSAPTKRPTSSNENCDGESWGA